MLTMKTFNLEFGQEISAVMQFMQYMLLMDNRFDKLHRTLSWLFSIITKPRKHRIYSLCIYLLVRSSAYLFISLSISGTRSHETFSAQKCCVPCNSEEKTTLSFCLHLLHLRNMRYSLHIRQHSPGLERPGTL